MNRVLIGKILRPRGLKGELKVQILTNKPEIFSSAKTVFIDSKSYEMGRGSVQNGYAYIVLAGADRIETAEKFRNKEIYVNAADIILSDDEVFTDDLIGFAVLNCAGEKIGTVKAVENYGGGDFFEVAVQADIRNKTADGGTGAYRYVQIPNEDEFITETNMTDKTITVTDNALQSETVL